MTYEPVWSQTDRATPTTDMLAVNSGRRRVQRPLNILRLLRVERLLIVCGRHGRALVGMRAKKEEESLHCFLDSDLVLCRQ